MIFRKDWRRKVRVLNWIAKTPSGGRSTGNILKPPVAAQPLMSLLSRLFTALEQAPGVDAASLHHEGSGMAPSAFIDGATRLADAASLGGCLQLFIEGEDAVLVDDVGDGRHLYLRGSSGHFGRWRYAVERHRPLIGRIHEEVA